MPPVNEPVTVWTSEAGSPVRLVWRSRGFLVSDTPTALVGTSDWWKPFEAYSYGIGHAPLDIAGWRFQATALDGETHVFDVSQDADAATSPDSPSRHDGHPWLLVRIFD